MREIHPSRRFDLLVSMNPFVRLMLMFVRFALMFVPPSRGFARLVLAVVRYE